MTQVGQLVKCEAVDYVILMIAQRGLRLCVALVSREELANNPNGEGNVNVNIDDPAVLTRAILVADQVPVGKPNYKLVS